MPNCRGEAVIKCFRGKIVGNVAQNLQNDPQLQLGTKGLLFKVYNRLEKSYEM